MNLTDKPWFAANRFGIGASFPIAWQGWVMVAVFIAAVAGSAVYAPESSKPWLAAIVIIAFIVLAAAKTKGGWRWRWGRKD